MPNTIEAGLSIEVSGIDVELQCFAERDIRTLVGSIGAATEQNELPFSLKLVRITDRFQDDVNQLLQERAGPRGYVAARENAHLKYRWNIGFLTPIEVPYDHLRVNRPHAVKYGNPNSISGETI